MGKGESKLSSQTIADLKVSTNFTEEEIRKWHRSFVKDVPSGKLTLREFQSVYSQIFPYGNSTTFSTHAFNAFDANHDGVIDFKEFLCALSLGGGAGIEEKLKFAFKMYDVDGDGFISWLEMHQVIEGLYKMLCPNSSHGNKYLQDRTDEIFESLDLDKDGKLSLEEFIEGAKKDPSIMEIISFTAPTL